MSYQVLARTYRPTSFDEVVGQEVILQVLKNALSSERLHHAYLFSGTRGVGKTTLGRLFAKCLNCETGITPTPCNKCQHCCDINAGKFIDLIEIDAASRTKVDDTRALLDNVPYAPASGRFKVYLIDEVHMLSGHSFNALLKTLEEPPSHVKFILATTDPEKLPITIHSRCLQLHLSLILPDKITAQLANLLGKESIPFEEKALPPLSIAAKGSMRDALSLLDQAIAYGAGKVTVDNVNNMLGLSVTDASEKLLTAIHTKNGDELLNITASLATQGEDFARLLEALLETLHHIATYQFTKRCNDPLKKEKIEAFSKNFSPEDIQLFYEICIKGRSSLLLAPSVQMGFEMIVMRIMTFQPIDSTVTPKVAPQKTLSTSPKIVPKSQEKVQISAENWLDITQTLGLVGVTSALAKNCSIVNFKDNKLELRIAENHAAFMSDRSQKQLSEALSTWAGKEIKVKVSIGKTTVTLAKKESKEKNEQHESAKSALLSDDAVKGILDGFNAKLDDKTIELT
jgi:DNA polymerase-3 subunit gamma/tau